MALEIEFLLRKLILDLNDDFYRRKLVSIGFQE